MTSAVAVAESAIAWMKPDLVLSKVFSSTMVEKFARMEKIEDSSLMTYVHAAELQS